MSGPLLNLVYDGECKVCKAFVRWVEKRDRFSRIVPIPYQDSQELQRLGLSRREARLQVYVVEEGDRRQSGAAAVNRVFEVLGGPWRFAAKAYAFRPVAFLENRLSPDSRFWKRPTSG